MNHPESLNSGIPKLTKPNIVIRDKDLESRY